MADDDAQILKEAKKLPLAERVVHKSWKARCDAYNDMLLTCERAFSGDDPCFVELGAARYALTLPCDVADLLNVSRINVTWVGGPQCMGRITMPSSE